jgi:hypothetical protein
MSGLFTGALGCHYHNRVLITCEVKCWSSGGKERSLTLGDGTWLSLKWMPSSVFAALYQGKANPWAMSVKR